MIDLEPKHLDVISDIEAIDQLLVVRGLRLVDVGCGPGNLSRALAERGAEVVAIEPDPQQAAANRTGDQTPGVSFHEAPAQAMPVAEASVDGVVFSRSLHHVPGDAMDAALGEAMRVLKPETGFLFVLEPEVTGSYHDLLKPFHDESQVRSLAREALDRVAIAGFETCEAYAYESHAEFDGFEQFCERYTSATYLNFDAARVASPAVRNAFERGYDGTVYRFTAPHWIGLFRGVISAHGAQG